MALETVLTDRMCTTCITSYENREKLQAMQMFKDTHLVKLELLSNANTIDNALHYIRTKQQQD